ncbi:MAG: hypothetical protein RUDDFDWM_002084 [Candidatus Fervidibacterota bacterium]
MTVIILAGGKAKRFGMDKALLNWHGKPLLWRIAERFQEAGFTVIVAGGPLKWAQRLQWMPLHIVADLPAHEGFGPLAGIEAGLLSTSDRLIGVVACDLPFAEPILLSWLSEQIGDADAIVPIVDNKPQPLHAVYARSCLPHLVAQLESEDKSVNGFLKQLKVVHVEEERWQKIADTACLKVHLNDPEDLKRLQILPDTPPTLTAPETLTPVISFVGFSGVGKTALIERVIQRLTTKGYKVGVIKHHHGQADTVGKDTWRYRNSGAAVIALVASDGMTLFLAEENLTAQQALKRLVRQSPVDLVLVEGFKQSPFPKLIVLPHELTPDDAQQMLSQLLAQVGDTSSVIGLIGRVNTTLNLPQFAHDELERLCKFIEQWMRKHPLRHQATS